MKKRSKFSLSSQHATTFNIGQLISCGMPVPIKPGDSVRHSIGSFIRFSPMLAPIMHPMEVVIQSFFVPNRLVWGPGDIAAPNDLGWEEFITGGEDNTDVQTTPTFTTGGTNNAKDQIPCDQGLPHGSTGIDVNLMMLAGYNLIWNDRFRDPDIQNEVDIYTNYDRLNVNWKKDRLTSARPWEQKGADVMIPLGGGAAPISGVGVQGATTHASQAVKETDGTTPTYTNAWGGTYAMFEEGASGYPNAYAELNAVDAIDVNQLLMSLGLQKFADARAMYGSDMVDYLNYIGIRSSDLRMRKPEYLGGGTKLLATSEVLQTAEGTNAVGTMRGHGVAALRTPNYRKFFEEHGYIHTVMFVRPVPVYMDAINYHYLKVNKEDYYQQELESVGQRALTNKEVYAAHTTPDGTFGWGHRYQEYREHHNSVSGDFRDTVANFWHASRDWSSDQSLNDAFLKCEQTSDISKIFAVATEDTIYARVYHSCVARRLMKPRHIPSLTL